MREQPHYQSELINNYDLNNSSRTLAGSFLQKSHTILEKTLPISASFDRVIEVGAGSGHHYSYVSHDYNQYVMTDGSAAMLEIAAKKYASQCSTGKLQIEQQDATSLSYPNASFDRLIATHVLEHLPNPVEVLREWNRVVRPGGIISIVLPCDPGVLWRLGRYLGPRRNAKKVGLEYDYLCAAEHINSIFNLVVFLKYHFELVSETWYPARVPMPDLNLFYVCHIQTAER